MTQRDPRGLGPGGLGLWRSITAEYELDAVQEVLLEEACRAKDRCDRLDELLQGDGEPVWARLPGFELTVGSVVLNEANRSGDLMKQLLAALRLPDARTGRRPQRRGARGAYLPRRF